MMLVEVRMFSSIKSQLLKTISGVAAKQLVADISRHHRIQASPEYRQAAEMIYETLLAWGLEAQMLSYPANESTRFWGMRMFQEWSGVAGTLRLTTPASQARTLADYREVRLSLIPRSAPFEGEVQVAVPKNKGEEAEDYEGLDISGKVVITSGQVMRVHQLAVEERNAVGIIFDGMRTLEPVSPEWALPDAIQYTSFWWWNTSRKCFGFALTPRQGQWLRRLVQNAPVDEPVRLHARVVSRLYDGTIENVTATIPGQTDDEILLVSHLCHPTPCANDNASGAAVAMEVAHALHTLVEAGDLPRPRRTIRFLWMPEMTGTFAYLNTHVGEAAFSRMTAGLNLDMVGEDQEQCSSVMLIDSPPEASASFAVDLLERIREELFDEARSLSQRGRLALFRYATVPFSGGSDHYIFSDPSIGVPMPMLIQWPDRFYHTTADTLDKVSPETLKRSGLLAGIYVYWLATAGAREVEWLAREMTARFKRRIVALLQEAVTSRMAKENELDAASDNLPWQQRVDYWIERQQRAFESLGRFKVGFDPKPWSRGTTYFATNEWMAVEDLLQRDMDPEQRTGTARTLEGDERAQRVPRRAFPGPLWEQTLLRYHAPELAERLHEWRSQHKEHSGILPVLALYWATGGRSLAEIVKQVELETGVRAPEYIADYFEILAELGVIEW
jgi:aminopeptidase YwaD